MNPVHNTVDVDKTLHFLIKNYSFTTILDIGAGRCLHTDFFREHGKVVTATDYYAIRSDVVEGDYMGLKFPQHDAVWCSHVLEHQLNVQLFLEKMLSEVKEGGVIAITVPPLKHYIVGGHVSLWNAGLLLYRLILAGIDCSEASVRCYGYNISVIVRKKTITLPKLYHDAGDIELLSEWFPIEASQNFDGECINCNWEV